MFASYVVTALLAFASSSFVVADVTPSEPGPGDSFKEGAQCPFTWIGDTDSQTNWQNMAVELMTGSNYEMVHLTTVATDLDGTQTGSFQFTCPEVTLHSAVYFYQFTSPLSSNKTWTTRFAITSPTGDSTPPPNPTQPGSGEDIPWGIGALTDPSTAVAAPNGVSDSTNGTTSGLPTGSSSSSSLPSSSSIPLSSAPIIVATSTGLTTRPSPSASNSSSSASSSQTAEVDANTNAALGVDAHIWQVVSAVGASTLAFALLL